MANTYVDYTASAGQTDFAFNFPYLEDEHIKVYINSIEKLPSDFTISTSPATKIVLNVAATGGETVRVRRKSQPNDDLVDFVNGSILTESELDRGYRHTRYLAEEASEFASVSLELEGSLEGSQITNGTVSTTKITDGAITEGKLANGAVTSDKLANGAVATDKIGADAVDGTKIADNSIDSEHYVDGSIDTAHIADNQITADKISASDATFNIQSDGKVGIGIAAPTEKLDVRGFVNIENTTGDSLLAITSGGSNPKSILNLGDQANSHVGRIQYDHLFDRLTFYTSHILGVTPFRMSLNTNGLDVNGDVSSNGVVLTSDDRVKHNEQVITNAVSAIKQLVAKKYFKTKELYEPNHNFNLDGNGTPVGENGQAIDCKVEVGVIAQDVANIPELAFAVSSDEVNENGEVVKPHGLDYNSLFTYAVAAIKEQQSIIEDLKLRVEALEN